MMHSFYLATFSVKKSSVFRHAPASPKCYLFEVPTVYLESRMKPQNKQQLVEGIKAFWARKVTEQKCEKYIDHVLKKVVPAGTTLYSYFSFVYFLHARQRLKRALKK